LIERCRAGDLAAFEPLVEKYRQRVYRLAYNVLRDADEAWDVSQDAFIRAFQALPSFRGDSAFYTWLFRIAMNVARDRARQHAARGRAFGTECVDEKDWDLALVAASAEAQQVVRFGTRIVLASDTPPTDTPSRAPEPPDERLEAFLPKLRQLFRYNHYTSLERYRGEVKVGATQRWPVPGDRRLEITPQGVRKDTVTFNVRLIRGSVAEVATSIQAQSGNPAVIGGPRHGAGTLIILLWTHPTP